MILDMILNESKTVIIIIGCLRVCVCVRYITRHVLCYVCDSSS